VRAESLRSLRVLLLVLFVAAVAVVVYGPRTAHRDTFLLLAEYGFLLPAFVLAFRAFPRGNGEWRLPAPPIILTLAVFLALNLIVRGFITQDVAAGDESAYHFQARLFAHGLVAAEAPPDVTVVDRPLRSVFRFHHHAMIGDRWLTQYPPGWPALLSLAWRLHLDWLLNPILGVWIVLLTWRVGSLLYSPRTGALAAAIATLSISFQHQTVGYLSHPSCGALLITATYFYLRGTQEAGWRNFALSLLCIAGASLIRPYTGFCVGVVLGALLLIEARKQEVLPRFVMLSGGVGLTCLGVYLVYNLSAHGGVSSYRSGGWAASDVFAGSPFDLVRSIAMFTRWSIQATMMYGFPFLIPLATLALLDDRERRAPSWLLAGLFLSLVAGYSLTKIVSGSYFGERYYYEMYFALCVLAARGLVLLFETRPIAVLRTVAPALILCVAVYGFHAAVYLQRASETYDPYVAIRKVAREVSEGNSVVFLPVNVGRETNFNQPDWRHASSVYLEDPGERLHGPVTAILGRRAWYVIAYDPVARSASVSRKNQP
jgi:hypothetical protein